VKLFVFANQKGGVGKTTLAVHMAIHAHRMGFHTLLVDLDQQGSATFLLTGDPNYHQTVERTALDLWYPDREIPIQQSPVFGFDFLQASQGLDAVDGFNSELQEGIQALRRLETLDYHLVVVDCPPAPGVRQIAPMFVADKIVVAVTPDALGTQGLVSMVQVIAEQVRPVRPDLELRILTNRLKANSARNIRIAEEIANGFPDLAIPQVLYEREDVRTGLITGKPYWEVCRDEAQKDAWYQVFDRLLRGVPNDEDDGGIEVDEPENAQAILDAQLEGTTADNGGQA